MFDGLLRYVIAAVIIAAVVAVSVFVALFSYLSGTVGLIVALAGAIVLGVITFVMCWMIVVIKFMENAEAEMEAEFGSGPSLLDRKG